MKIPALRTVAETIGVVAIVLSLLFVGLQIRQTQRIATSELRASVYANGAQLNELIIENADVWARGNAGEALEGGEAAIYYRLIQSYNDFYYNLVEQSKLLELGWEKQDEAMLIGFLHDNPGAFKVWRDREIQVAHWRSTLGAYDKPEAYRINYWADPIEDGVAELAAAEGQ